MSIEDLRAEQRAVLAKAERLVRHRWWRRANDLSPRNERKLDVLIEQHGSLGSKIAKQETDPG